MNKLSEKTLASYSSSTKKTYEQTIGSFQGNPSSRTKKENLNNKAHSVLFTQDQRHFSYITVANNCAGHSEQSVA